MQWYLFIRPLYTVYQRGVCVNGIVQVLCACDVFDIFRLHEEQNCCL